MLFVTGVTRARRIPLPEGYHTQTLRDKLYYVRSDVPAVTHLDYSARVQTVQEDSNGRYYGLLKSLKSLTGCGVVVNTSFNVSGEPIVMSPEHAYVCFANTEMDYLVLGDYVFDKKQIKRN